MKRAPHECEAYSKLYPEKIAKAYEEQRHTVSTAIEICNLKRRIANALLKEETADVQQQVRNEIEKHKKERVEELKKKLGGLFEKKQERTPEEYQR